MTDKPSVEFDRSLTAWIAEVFDPKGLRAGMNKTGHTKGLTHLGRE
jgi:hypothetical protein